MPITRTPIIDDDGSGMTGTVLDNAWKQEFYNQIDAALLDTVGGPINLTAGQIKFPITQNPSADPNTLDDYEEGAFTPTLAGASGSVGGYSVRTGRYIKIGRFVFCDLHVALTAKGSLSGELKITGFPATPSGAIAPYNSAFSIPYFFGLAINVASLGGIIDNSGALLRYMAGAGASGITGLTAANITDSVSLLFSVAYHADA